MWQRQEEEERAKKDEEGATAAAAAAAATAAATTQRSGGIQQSGGAGRSSVAWMIDHRSPEGDAEGQTPLQGAGEAGLEHAARSLRQKGDPVSGLPSLPHGCVRVRCDMCDVSLVAREGVASCKRRVAAETVSK